MLCWHAPFSHLQMSILNLLFFFQIRAEKAYYIADPEVDSLVSWKLFCVFYGQLDILSFYSKKNIPFCLQHWADILCWQQKAKNLMKMHTHLHQPLRIILRKVFVTGMVHKLENILNNIMNMVQSCVEKENSLSCSNLNYLSTPESFIFLSPTPFWVQKEGNWKTNDVEFCSDCAYRHGWIHF